VTSTEPGRTIGARFSHPAGLGGRRERAYSKKLRGEVMARKPNYDFERRERERQKAEKKAAKARAKAEKAEAERAESAPSENSESLPEPS